MYTHTIIYENCEVESQRFGAVDGSLGLLLEQPTAHLVRAIDAPLRQEVVLGRLRARRVMALTTFKTSQAGPTASQQQSADQASTR